MRFVDVHEPHAQSMLRFPPAPKLTFQSLRRNRTRSTRWSSRRSMRSRNWPPFCRRQRRQRPNHISPRREARQRRRPGLLQIINNILNYNNHCPILHNSRLRHFSTIVQLNYLIFVNLSVQAMHYGASRFANPIPQQQGFFSPRMSQSGYPNQQQHQYPP